jgi:NADPH:quinone reductase
VLVLGAGGGIGVTSVELATSMGARVFATASSEEKLMLARERGAVDGLVYPANLEGAGVRELGDRLKTLVGKRGADVVVDPVGGYYAEAALRALGHDGQHLVIGFTAGIPRMPLNLLLLKSCRVIGVNWGLFNNIDPRESDRNSRELLDLYRRGLLRPVVSRYFPLEAGAAAIAHLAGRHAVGKLVVLVEG